MTSSNSAALPSSLSRRFVRYALAFGVSVGIGLAPFLGKVAVPGFDALLGLFPIQIQGILIPLSAFLMGLVALGVQFYHNEGIAAETIRRYFRNGMIAMFLVFFVFVVLYMFFVVNISGGRLLGSAIVTSSRLPGCQCKENWSDERCLVALSLNPAAANSCWGGTELKVRALSLMIPYLLIMSGFGALVGLLLLKPPPPPPKEKKPQKGGRPAGAKPPKDGSSPATRRRKPSLDENARPDRSSVNRSSPGGPSRPGRRSPPEHQEPSQESEV